MALLLLGHMSHKMAVPQYCFPFSPGLQIAFDRDWEAGRITRENYRNGSEDGALAYKLLIQTGNKKEPFNLNRVSVGCPRHIECGGGGGKSIPKLVQKYVMSP